ncbi:LysR family transcriptional regulator [Agaricicola taiwanensis]|uniref:LysR family transcriptional regulator n=1 Tax=Agaricicola taiwanensis TaxID=591372 RepID=A0A8J2YCV4_9RHOB|nr:LysR substrate-binding domain-containing protein [Agaricicola taiwanensis]GGE31826.1 LysR family transcriptional regulator [Agaricicola taiwanensis]
MNYRQLEVFQAIMHTGSVTAAARMLNLTQPAVTKILRHTEDQLRFQLFSRVKGRLVPTQDAQALFPDVERVFDEMREVRQSIEDIRSARSGRLSIVSIPTLGEAILPQAISTFMAERPDVTLDFDVRPRRAVVQSIATQRADLGFAFLALEHAAVASTELCRGGVTCIMRRDHPLVRLDVITPANLVGHRLVFYSKDQGLRTLIDAVVADARVELEPSLEVGWISTAWSLVNKGIGVALVDNFSQLDAIYPDIIMKPFLPHIPLRAELLTTKNIPLSRLARDFLKTVSQCIRAPAV